MTKLLIEFLFQESVFLTPETWVTNRLHYVCSPVGFYVTQTGHNGQKLPDAVQGRDSCSVCMRGQRCRASQALSGVQGDSVCSVIAPRENKYRKHLLALLFAATLETSAQTIFVIYRELI